jgi:hypothetical protein
MTSEMQNTSKVKKFNQLRKFESRDGRECAVESGHISGQRESLHKILRHSLARGQQPKALTNEKGL